MPTTSASSNPSAALNWLIQRRKSTAYGLFILAAGAALAALWLGRKQPDGYLAMCMGLALFALVNVCLGMYQQLRAPERYPEPEATRLFLLGLAAFNGIVLSLTGAVLAVHWWDAYLDWLKGEPGPNNWQVYASLLPFFGGLVIMFAGLQLARGEERDNPVLRRLLYGYNSLLAAVLLLCILIVANVLAYARFSAPIDFTASSIYTLSSRSASILRGLDKTARLYVIILPGSSAYLEVQTLINNCRDVNDKIPVEYIDPNQDDEKLRELARQYAFTPTRQGLLIVYGDGKDVNHRYINLDDLYEIDPMGTREAKFKGEDALITALNSLAEGGARPIVYFTQGHGELDLTDVDDSRMDVGLGALKSRLEKRNYDVKPLTFKPGDPQVPADAAIIVIAGPKDVFPPPEVDALREFAKPARPGAKKGKLVVLMDIALTPEGAMRQTGLEPLLHEFNVEVGNERVMNLTLKNPLMDVGVVNPRLADRNPIASQFSGRNFRLYDVRPVRPAPEPSARSGETFSAEPLIYIPASIYIWAEPNLRGNATELAENLLKNTQEQKKKLSEEPISVAAIVTSPPDMSDPHMLQRQSSDGVPRLAVFGTSSIASNYFCSDRRTYLEYELVANTLDWLREKPQSIGIEPKNRSVFILDPSVSVDRMVFLPASLMLLAIIGVGASVWLIRRQ